MSKTKTAAPAAPSTPAAPVDPAAVLQERERRKQIDGWHKARALLVQPDLSEGDIIACADALDAAGLSGKWIGPLRLAISMRNEAKPKTASLAELGTELRAAREKATAREAEIRVEIRRLESLLPGFGKTPTPELREVTRIGQQIEPAIAAENVCTAIEAQFAPLFDDAMAMDGFRLPRIGDGLLPALRAALDTAGLLDGEGRPAALTEPAPTYKPRPVVTEPPVQRCSVAPSMELAKSTPVRSIRREVHEAAIPGTYPQ